MLPIGKHRYTEEELEFLRQNVEGTTLQEQTDLFNAKFGTNLNKEKIAAIKSLHKIKPKVPPPRSPKCGFQKGHNGVYENQVEKYKVGDVRLSKIQPRRPYVYEIKVAQPDVWRPKHHVLYEQYHNVKLSPDSEVIFVDGDKTNFNKDNLQLV